MTLVTRISRLFKADVHAVLDQIEEPAQLLRQSIREMEEELLTQEQRIRIAAHDQQALIRRRDELDESMSDIDEELGLCFASGKDDLARSLIRRKLETELLVKKLGKRIESTEIELAEQRALVEENRATLESLKQKAELFHVPAGSHDDARFDDLHRMTRQLSVSDDEVEIAYLREQDRRRAT